MCCPVIYRSAELHVETNVGSDPTILRIKIAPHVYRKSRAVEFELHITKQFRVKNVLSMQMQARTGGTPLGF